ncbi:MAG: hypothetical protein SGCHY_005407, partial [Lobulomycetales sp.]
MFCALAFRRHGNPAKVVGPVEIPLPGRLGADQVHLRFLASPVNPADINQIQGVYPVKPRFIHKDITVGGNRVLGEHGYAIGGNEGVALVLEVGDAVQSIKAGDWVLPDTPSFGTWRTEAVCLPKDLLKIDNRGGKVDILTAATVAVNPCSAYRMIQDNYAFLDEHQADNLQGIASGIAGKVHRDDVHRDEVKDEVKDGGKVQRDEVKGSGKVLIQNGGNSAVGQSVIQLARSWGIRTISIVRHRAEMEQTRSWLAGLGADMVVDADELSKSPAQVAEEIQARFGRLPRLALNCVGGRNASDMMRLLGKDARMVTYGGMSREPLTVPTGPLIFRNLQCTGFWLTEWISRMRHTDPLAKGRMIQDILDLSANGGFTHPACRSLSWAASDPSPLALDLAGKEK